MGYAATLLRGWGRREWLTVIIIAVTTAFLIGSATLLITASTYTETLEDDLGSTATVTHVNSYTEAEKNAPSSAVVLRYAQISEGNKTVRLLGVPPDAPRELESASVAWEPATIPNPPESGLRGPVDQPTVREFNGKPLTVDPGDDNGLFPRSWYVGSTETISSFNQTAGLILNPQTGSYLTSNNAVPLIGTLPFLLGGVAEIIRTLSIAAVGGGMLILIVVYSVTQMAIKERSQTIRVVRETGGEPRRLLAVLVARAGSLTGVGVCCGIIIGVGITRGVIAVAGYAGIPVSLRITLTPTLLTTIVQLSGVLFIAGIIAGIIAGWPVTRGDPAKIGNNSTQHTTGLLSSGYSVFTGLTFIRWRAAIPTTATLSVFILVVFLLMSTATAVAPLVTTTSGTIVESDAPHPLNSRIETEYAKTLRTQGIQASPEILYAQRYGEHPYLARGANFTAFQKVTDVRVVKGNPPTGPSEAVIGESLSNTLDISVGESMIVTGSVSPGVHRLTIVGTFRGSGITDDQLIIPIETAQGLATRENAVHMIRTAGRSGQIQSNTTADRGIVVSEIRGPARITANTTFNIEIELRNLANTRQRESLIVTIGEQTRSVQVTLDSQQTTEKTVSFSLQTPRAYTVSVASVKRSLRVVEPDSLTLPDEFPRRAPPDATLLVPSITTNETVVEDATVTVGDQTAQTGSRGAATIGVPSTPGEYSVTVNKQGYQSVRVPLVVDPAVTQRLRAELSVNPSTGTPYTRPEITVRVANPWGEFIIRNLTLTAPGTAESRTVEFPSGNVTELTFDGKEVGFTEDIAPGRYPLKLYADGELLARTTYRVEEASGGGRGSLQPQGEYASGTGVGRAIENVFGNVQVLFLVMIILAGTSTIGGTTAAFAQAVQSRQQEIGIYRATGATRRQLLWLLASDASRIAVPAGIISFIGVYIVIALLSTANLLVVFGVRLSVPVRPFIYMSILIVAMSLAIVSAAVAGWAFLRGDVRQYL